MNLFNLWNSLAEICKFDSLQYEFMHDVNILPVQLQFTVWVFPSTLCTGCRLDEMIGSPHFLLKKCKFKSLHLHRKGKLLEVTQDSSWRNAYINFYDNLVIQINPVCASSQCIALLLWEAYATWHWLSLLNGKNMLSLSSYTDVAYVPRSSLTVVLKIVYSVFSLRRM